MSIDPGFSIVISFVGFSWIFAKKIYPILIKQLDNYINSVKFKIQKSEDMQKDAYASLKSAYINKDNIEEIIKLNQEKSKKRIAILKEENTKYLKALRMRHEASLKAQLEAEARKQKNLLIEKLSDEIIQELVKNISTGKSKFVVSLDKSELYKLLGNTKSMSENPSKIL